MNEQFFFFQYFKVDLKKNIEPCLVSLENSKNATGDGEVFEKSLQHLTLFLIN